LSSLRMPTICDSVNRDLRMWIPFEAEPRIPHIPGGVYGVPVIAPSRPGTIKETPSATDM
jgi:hypothetical protein